MIETGQWHIGLDAQTFVRNATLYAVVYSKLAFGQSMRKSGRQVFGTLCLLSMTLYKY